MPLYPVTHMKPRNDDGTRLTPFVYLGREVEWSKIKTALRLTDFGWSVDVVLGSDPEIRVGYLEAIEAPGIVVYAGLWQTKTDADFARNGFDTVCLTINNQEGTTP
jgi:hypothetical protein